MLKPYLKHELVAPAGAISELGLLVLEQARDSGFAEFLADTTAMCESAVKLADLVGTDLTSEQLEAARAGSAGDFFFTVRTLVNQVQGFCTLLLKEARAKEMYHSPVVLMLEFIHKHCTDITNSVVRLEHTEPPKPPRTRTTAACRPRHQGRLLVVDASGGAGLVRRLEKQRHIVQVAQTGAKAIEMLAGTDVDVILLDQRLPDMEGHELLKRLKADEKLHHLPVIMVWDAEERHTTVECIEWGAEDYLSKQAQLADRPRRGHQLMLEVWLEHAIGQGKCHGDVSSRSSSSMRSNRSGQSIGLRTNSSQPA